MDFSIFDLVIGSIILLLGLKGILNGFFKELFGLIGIVGGIFIGSHVATDVGHFLSEAIFKFESPAAISLLGFIVTLVAFWGSMIGVGVLFKKFSNLSGLGIIDKVLGFVFGAGKFFFIASVIVYSFYNFKVVRNNINMQEGILLPILIKTGSYIIKIDGAKIADDINKSIDSGINSAKQSLSDEASKEILKSAAIEKDKIIKIVTEKLEESDISLTK
ncbi:CvpA family protein [Sulfurimonas sp. MAG313]|nr:CvpA family protein [Sulfurimonas sp. MAG313]MDF1881356.1 CvpA family protein [Sulfurimonas sp. MAG313]